MSEAIAVIGMAGRFPGAADVTAFWERLAAGDDCLIDVEDEDLRQRGELPEYLDHPDYVRRRPVMAGADMFDARCFGMTPRDAEIRDPQQRVLLEVAHSALENAGYDPSRYPGAIAVFAGTNVNRYRIDHLEPSPEIRQTVSFLAVEVGNAPDYVATFVAHRLGLRGASTTVQTACSTALTAVHLACLSLRARDCDMAIAGASSVGMPLDYGYLHVDGGILARDGTTRPFDANADGTNFGSGAGAVLLKRLDDALADRDTIVAVIRGSALNNDGDRKSSFVSPSPAGQADCVADAIRAADVDPASISYVEAHGTGTKVGDPIEIRGLTDGFRAAADTTLPAGYCAVGSVKGNVGHTGQASGISGFIKTALALRHELIPASIHVSTVNPLLDLAGTPFRIATEARPWPRSPDAPRRAGVSSFGFGGTNSHVVLEEAPQAVRESWPTRDAELLVWSGAQNEAVDQLRQSLADHFTTTDDPDAFRDSAYTLRIGRRERTHRAALVARDAADATRLLRAGTAVIRSDGVRREPVFCFPGQGGLAPGMLRRLCETEPTFRRHCDEGFALLRPHHDDDLATRWATAAEPADLSETVIAQPLLFVLEHALAATLADWGLTPARLIGHSVGELVAATVAGVFDLADGLRAVAARAQLMQEMPRGAMLAVATAEDQVLAYATGAVTLAAANGPRQCVLAGPVDEIDAVADRLRGDGMAATVLRTSHAFHSAMMAPAAKDFEAVLGAMTLRPARLPIVSGATGALMTPDEAVSPAFWAGQLVEPVRFAAAMRTVCATTPACLIEVGPGRTLSGLARGIPEVRESNSVALCTDDGALDATLGRLWVDGLPIDLARRDEHTRARRVPVPGYPYQRRRFWVERPSGHRPPRDNELLPPSAETRDEQAPEPAPPAPSAPVAPPSRWSLATIDWVRFRHGRSREPGPGVAGIAAAVVLPRSTESAATVRTAFQLAGYRAVRAAVAGAGDDSGMLVEPTSEGDWDALLDAAATPGEPLVVAYAALLDGPETVTLKDIDAQLDRGYFAVLACVRAAARAGRHHRGPVTVLVLTRAGVDVTGAEPLNPATGMLSGLLRTVEQEHPGVRTVVVDVATGTPADVIGEAVAELAAPIVALRGAAMWRPMLRAQTASPQRPRLRHQGVYLITGGLGGLGLAVARALAETGHRPRLALIGRSGPPAVGSARGREVADAIAGIEAAGAEMITIAADVADPEALRAAVERVEAAFGTVHGIVHAAGAPSGGLLDTRTRAATSQVFAPKVHGTLALADCFADRPPLDFQILFSSQAGYTGLLGSADYAAANAFLDAYASRPPKAAEHVISIAWPAWSDIGMWARPPTPTVTEHIRVFNAAEHWELDEHRYAGAPQMPTTALLEAVVAAARAEHFGPDGPVELRDTVFLAPAIGAGPMDVRVVFTPVGDGFRFTVHSRDLGQGWVARANGSVSPRSADAPPTDPAAPTNRDALAARVAAGVPPTGTTGFGPRWRTVTRIADGAGNGSGDGVAELVLPPEFHGDIDDHPMHAALLDAACLALAPADDGPFLYRRLVQHAPLTAHVFAHGRATASPAGMSMLDVDISDADTGALLVSVAGRTVRPASSAPSPAPSAAPLPAPTVEAAASPLDAPAGRELLRPRDGVDAFLAVLGGAYPPVVFVEPPGNRLDVPGLPWWDADDEPRTLPAGRAIDGPDVVVPPAIAPRDPTSVAGRNETSDRAGGVAVPANAGPPAVSTTPSGIDEITDALFELWAEALGLDDLRVDDDFFALGGDSLVAVQLSARARQRFGVQLSAAALFEASTIRSLANEINALKE